MERGVGKTTYKKEEGEEDEEEEEEEGLHTHTFTCFHFVCLYTGKKNPIP